MITFALIDIICILSNLKHCASLINQINSLVGQETVTDMLGASGDSQFQSVIVIDHAMIVFVYLA